VTVPVSATVAPGATTATFTATAAAVAVPLPIDSHLVAFEFLQTIRNFVLKHLIRTAPVFAYRVVSDGRSVEIRSPPSPRPAIRLPSTAHVGHLQSGPEQGTARDAPPLPSDCHGLPSSATAL
jgi:hypothetical protein